MLGFYGDKVVMVLGLLDGRCQGQSRNVRCGETDSIKRAVGTEAQITLECYQISMKRLVKREGRGKR